MIKHDKCAAFEDKILELEAQIKKQREYRSNQGARILELEAEIKKRDAIIKNLETLPIAQENIKLEKKLSLYKDTLDLANAALEGADIALDFDNTPYVKTLVFIRMVKREIRTALS